MIWCTIAGAISIKEIFRSAERLEREFSTQSEEITDNLAQETQRPEIISAIWNQGISLIPRYKGTKDRYPFAYKDYLEGKIRASLTDILEWSAKRYDFAAVCGLAGLVVFDFDSFEAYQTFWGSKNLAAKLPSQTLAVSTSRGIQLWFIDRSLDLQKTRTVIDCRSCLEMEIFLHHHLAACPGNVHPCGKKYELLGTSRIMRKDFVVNRAVDRLYNFGWIGSIYLQDETPRRSSYKGSKKLPPLNQEIDHLEKTVEFYLPYWVAGSGKHHRLLMALSGYLIRKGIKEESAERFLTALLLAANRDHDIRPSVQQLRWFYKNASTAKKIQGLPSLSRVMKEIEESRASS
jgi:hypothetical protein